MSDFCDFLPNDPACQPDEPVDPQPKGGDDGHMDDEHDDMDEDMGMEMMKA